MMNENQWIDLVVHSFYEKAKSDILIGYHFRNITDFDEHIPRISAFWELQLLGQTTKRYTLPFEVIKSHVPLGIKKGELGRWLVLFRKTLKDQTLLYPDKKDLEKKWEEKLIHFEGIFLRSLGL